MYDLVINNGILFDPARQLRLQGHVAIQDGRIAAISSGDPFQGKQELDASGHIVCPGFIDMHGHIDAAPYCAELSLRQGITTTVGGNCGASPLDLTNFSVNKTKQAFPCTRLNLSATLRCDVPSASKIRCSPPPMNRFLPWSV